MKNILKDKNGITLIVLVITIIILLILAGITISSLTGENGLFEKVKQAKEKSENAENYQNEIINDYGEEIEKYINGKKYKVASYKITGYNQENGKLKLSVKIGDNEKIEYEVIDGEANIYTVDNNGQQEKYLIQTKGFTKNERSTIENEKDLLELSTIVNMGNTLENKTIEVTNDIDLKDICYRVDGTVTNDKSWMPIGSGTNPFQGTFDGKGHTINNLYINSASERQGLFGYIDNGTIKNLTIGNTSSITGSGNVGGISGVIKNSIIENCINNASVVVNSTYTAGGIVGCINQSTFGKIRKCENNGNIKATIGNAGGIVGCVYNNSKNIQIQQCRNTADIQTINDSNVGGIVGIIQLNSTANIDESYNTGTIIAKTYATGGIVGNCYNETAIIANCYNTGKCQAGISSFAGILGNMDNSTSTQDEDSYAEVENCYNIGTISKIGIYGGIIGWKLEKLSYKVINNYWLSTCGANYGIGINNLNTGATPKNAGELKSMASTLGDAFIEDGKKIDINGNIVDNKDGKENIIYINGGYPILKWQVTE